VASPAYLIKTPNQTTPDRYEALNHWRGVAALGVVVFHTFNPWLAAPCPRGFGWLADLASQGWRGVHLFFVISGYCITQLAYREYKQQRRVTHFLVNRCLRIFPPYWVACAMAAALAVTAVPFNHEPLFTTGEKIGALPGSWADAFTHALLVDPLMDRHGYLLVAWSLSWEAAYYFVTSALLLAASVFGAWSAISLALLLAVAGTNVQCVTHLHSLSGWAEFVCGACVFAAHAAKLQGRPAWPWLAALAGLGGIGCANGGLSSMLLFAAIFALLLHWLRRYDSLSNMTPWAWLGRIGIMSYSLYLIHAPFISYGRNLASRFIPASSPWFIMPIAFFILASIGVARIFYKYIEAPIENWRHRLLSAQRQK
jgi:peptidoglycan/LPS O-acetylase OafA/YrhL